MTPWMRGALAAIRDASPTTWRARALRWFAMSNRGDDEDDAWYVTGDTTDGRPLQPFLTITVPPGGGVPRPRGIAFEYACGAVQAGAMVVTCDCGLIRQHDRPHDYVADIQLRGWICYCGIFNGEEKERQATCRTCASVRPL